MNKRKIILPFLIVMVALIIGGGIMFSRREYKAPEIISPAIDTGKKINIRPITNSDHVYGNPNANVLMIVYSDLECPSCQGFHSTMKTIMSQYAKTGEVAWVYRHFPIEKVHPNSMGAAIASECVASVAGENKFWEYIDELFTKAPNSLLPANRREIAKNLGVDESKFDACLILESENQSIKDSLADGRAIFEIDSNFGTPYIIFISRNGLQTQMSGNYELADVVEVINLLK